jgi:hypothetical protein
MLGIDRTICSLHRVNEKVKYPIRGVKVRLFSAVTGFCLRIPDYINYLQLATLEQNSDGI